MWRDRSGTSAGDVFALIHGGLAQTRAEIGRTTDLSRTAVAARVRQLVESGLVVEDAAGATTGGRPAGRLRVNPGGGVVLAASIGASKTKLGVCDLGGIALAETGLDVDTTLGPEVVLRTVGERLDRLREKADQPVRGVGVCVPGPVDAATGTVLESPLLPGWGGVPLTLGVTGVPVLVDNDVNALTLAEAAVRPGVTDLVHVKVSTGIGAGIIAGGVLQRGARGAAGEIGHNPVADGGGVGPARREAHRRGAGGRGQPAEPAGGGVRRGPGRGVRAAARRGARAGLPARRRTRDPRARHRAE